MWLKTDKNTLMLAVSHSGKTPATHMEYFVYVIISGFLMPVYNYLYNYVVYT